MGDLEARLRAEVTRRAQEFSPSVDLGERIAERVRQRRRRRLVAGLVSTALVAVVAVGVTLAGPFDEDSVRVGDDREVPTTTGSTTLSTSTSTQADSTTTPSPNGPSIGVDTPLSRAGIGPIRAGMTLRAAQATAGVTITPNPISTPGCVTAQIAGLDVGFVASGKPGEDPMDSVIGSVQGGRRTVEGVAIGDPITELDGIYGSPTRTLDYPYLPNGQVFVYVSGGFAYSVTTDGATVTELESGDPDWVANLEGCE